MLADTPDELHAMANRIGVARRHFQEGASHPHYDLCKSKRAVAVRCGTIEVSRKELVALLHRYRRKAANRSKMLEQRYCRSI